MFGLIPQCWGEVSCSRATTLPSWSITSHSPSRLYYAIRLAVAIVRSRLIDFSNNISQISDTSLMLNRYNIPQCAGETLRPSNSLLVDTVVWTPQRCRQIIATIQSAQHCLYRILMQFRSPRKILLFTLKLSFVRFFLYKENAYHHNLKFCQAQPRPSVLLGMSGV